APKTSPSAVSSRLSSVSQVISLDLRSSRAEGKKLDGQEEGEEEEELRYTHILNRVLPPDIRVLAWAPGAPDFCMMAVLFLIGQRMESPEIIDELLDVEKNPRKPQYSMAVEFPLVLYDCEFANLRWLYDREVQEFNVTHLQQLWANHAVKTQVLRNMLGGLDAAPVAAGK
ncbi:PREDICTED: tRNA pseudouridine(38/39) synthase-like, partial [Apaloderma vittatum]|uniref:tRNA pseudouridine(38/39) synthase-like n=1 Tax=Apaloderma vittatum TaxID=57397 RepID=UPI000521C1F7